MIIRTTTDPITLHDVPDPEHHPCVHMGDGENGIDVYFENEHNRQEFLHMESEKQKILVGNATDDYVAEG